MKNLLMRVSRLRLSQQILLLSLAIPCILALALAYFAANQVINSENKPKEVLSVSNSQSVLEKIDRNFYERFGDVQAFAYNKLAVQAATQDSVDNDIQEFINTMTSYYVLYDLMMVCDGNGKVVAVNTKDKSGQSLNTHFLLGSNISSEEWFKICMSSQGPAGGAFYSDFMINKDVASIYNTQGRGMAFAAPIKDSQGNVIGVWYNFASWEEVTVGIRREAEALLQQKHNDAFIIISNINDEVIDCEDKKLIFQSIGVDDLIHNKNSFEYKGRTISEEDYIFGTSEARGAYTYKGKNWKAITVIPKSKLSFATLFTGPLLKLILFVGCCLAIAVIVAVRFSKRISVRINSIKDIVLTLGKGELSEVTVSGHDEISEMTLSVSKLTEGLKQTALFAKEIGEGNLDTSFQPLSEKDVLGHSLVNMKESLSKVAEEDRKRNWSNIGFAKAGDILRNNSLSGSDLYNSILSFTIKYVKANQGGLFLLNKENEHDAYIELVACYAYDRKKFLEKRIGIGEGLIGQTILEKDTINLTEVPDKYLNITSGLGEATPKNILIVPLKNNDDISGVIELASFEIFEPYMIEFVEKIAESIASTISSVQMNEKTVRLLEQSQQMTEELRSQEEEMRQNMEELQATQEESQRREQKLIEEIEGLKATIVN